MTLGRNARALRILNEAMRIRFRRGLTFEFTGMRKPPKAAVAFPVQRRVRPHGARAVCVAFLHRPGLAGRQGVCAPRAEQANSGERQHWIEDWSDSRARAWRSTAAAMQPQRAERSTRGKEYAAP